jgi:hypothetical protein
VLNDLRGSSGDAEVRLFGLAGAVVS